MLAFSAALLEGLIANELHNQGKTQEAGASFISQASCLVDAGDFVTATIILRNTLRLGINSRLTEWIMGEIERISNLPPKLAPWY